MKKIFIVLVCCVITNIYFPFQGHTKNIDYSIEHSNPIDNKGLCGRIADNFCRSMFAKGELNFSWLSYKFERVQ